MKLKQGRKNHTKETAQQKVDERRGKGIYNLLGEFVNASTKLVIEHIPCGYQWETTQSSLMTKEFCPGCKLTGKSTKLLTIEERNNIVKEPKIEKDIEPPLISESYFIQDHNHKNLNFGYLMTVRSEIGEMETLSSIKSKFNNLPIIGNKL